MAPPKDDRKVSLSFMNWALGGSLVNVDQTITGKDGKLSRRVSSKLAIIVDAEGNKVYTDGTVKKREKVPALRPEPKLEPKEEVKKIEHRCKHGILKKPSEKFEVKEEAAEPYITCRCGKCGKSIKSKSEEKCKKHVKGKDDPKEEEKAKLKDDDKIKSKDEPKAEAKDSKDDKNIKQDKVGKKQKGEYQWTDELDKQLMALYMAKTPWNEILKAMRTNRKNCDARIEFLEKQENNKGDKKDEAAKFSNGTEASAWIDDLPNTNINFGEPFVDMGDMGGIFGDDFGGDPKNKDAKSSWGAPAQKAGDWITASNGNNNLGSSGGNDNKNVGAATSWNNGNSEPVKGGGGWNSDNPMVNAPWGDKSAAVHTVDVPSATPYGWDTNGSSVPGNSGDSTNNDPRPAGTRNGEWGSGNATSGGESWGGGNNYSGGGDSWDQKKSEELKPAKSSGGGWNDDNPFANISTDKKGTGTEWKSSGSAPADTYANSSTNWSAKPNSGDSGDAGGLEASGDKPDQGWGSKTDSGNFGAYAGWGSSDNQPMLGAWNSSEDKPQEEAVKTDGGGWNTSGDNNKKDEGASNFGGDGAWDSGNNTSSSGGNGGTWSNSASKGRDGGSWNTSNTNSNPNGQSGNGSNTWGSSGNDTSSTAAANNGGNNGTNWGSTHNTPSSSQHAAPAQGDNWGSSSSNQGAGNGANNNANPSNDWSNTMTSGGDNGWQGGGGWNNSNPHAGQTHPQHQNNGNSGNGPPTNWGNNNSSSGSNSQGPPPNNIAQSPSWQSTMNSNGNNNGGSWRSPGQNNTSQQSQGPNNGNWQFNPQNSYNSWQGQPQYANIAQAEYQNGAGNNNQPNWNRGGNWQSYPQNNYNGWQGPPPTTNLNQGQNQHNGGNNNQSSQQGFSSGNNGSPNQGNSSQGPSWQNTSQGLNASRNNPQEGQGHGQSQSGSQGGYWQNGNWINNQGNAPPMNNGDGPVSSQGPPQWNNWNQSPSWQSNGPPQNGNSGDTNNGGNWQNIGRNQNSNNSGAQWQSMQRPQNVDGANLQSSPSPSKPWQGTQQPQNINGGNNQGFQGPLSSIQGGYWQNNGPAVQQCYQENPEPNNSSLHFPNSNFGNHQGHTNTPAPPQSANFVNSPTTPQPHNNNVIGQWVWHANNPRVQPQNITPENAPVPNSMPSQPQNETVSNNQAAAPQHVNGSGLWVWHAASAPPVQPSPQTQTASYVYTDAVPTPAQNININGSCQWVGHGSTIPYWQAQNTAAGPNNLSSAAGKHVHFAAGTAGAHDIWNPQQGNTQGQTPALANVSLPSVFDNPYTNPNQPPNFIPNTSTAPTANPPIKTNTQPFNLPGSFPSTPTATTNPPPLPPQQNAGCTRTPTPYLKPDSNFSMVDCEVLEHLDAKHKSKRFQALVTEFFGWTGRMLCKMALEKKFKDDGLA